MSDAEGIQQELQDYLQQKGINTLFVNIVESLLLSKPDNPVQHIVNYLYTNFPDQCGNIQQPIISSSRSENTLDNNNDSNKLKQLGNHSDESESEDEDENEHEDQLGELIPQQSKRSILKGRRTSVSAETDTTSEKKPMENIVHPKSDFERQRILDILQHNILFKGLDDKQMRILLDAFFPKQYEIGEIIIKQGDDGDNFYVLDSGICEIYVDNELVQTCTEAMSFGELALMYNAPRAATVKVKETCKVWALDRKTFKYVLMETSLKKRERNQSLVKRVPLLDTLSEIERMKVADALRLEIFKDGEIIIKEGDAGNHFYIIDEGTAILQKQTSSNDAPVEIGTLKAGNYFGEISLLTTRPRQATVIAKGEVKCLVLDRRTFKRVMGPLEDILKRNLDQYNLVMANNI